MRKPIRTKRWKDLQREDGKRRDDLSKGEKFYLLGMRGVFVNSQFRCGAPSQNAQIVKVK